MQAWRSMKRIAISFPLPLANEKPWAERIITSAGISEAVKTLKKQVVLALTLGLLHIPIRDRNPVSLRNMLSNHFQRPLKRLQYISFQGIRQE